MRPSNATDIPRTWSSTRWHPHASPWDVWWKPWLPTMIQMAPTKSSRQPWQTPTPKAGEVGKSRAEGLLLGQKGQDRRSKEIEIWEVEWKDGQQDGWTNGWMGHGTPRIFGSWSIFSYWRRTRWSGLVNAVTYSSVLKSLNHKKRYGRVWEIYDVTRLQVESFRRDMFKFSFGRLRWVADMRGVTHEVGRRRVLWWVIMLKFCQGISACCNNFNIIEALTWKNPWAVRIAGLCLYHHLLYLVYWKDRVRFPAPLPYLQNVWHPWQQT